MSFPNGLYRFEDFELDQARRSVARAGVPIALSPKAFDVLSYLVANPARVVTKEELLKAVWPNSFVEEGNLAQHISSVRKALAAQATCIVTIPGRGYQFTAEVRPAGSALSEPSGFETDELVVQRIRERTRIVVEERTTVQPALPAGVPHTGIVKRSSRSASMAFVSERFGTRLVALAAAVLAIPTGWLLWRELSRPAPDHHQVVLAEFDNETGDPTFSLGLNRAFKIDLEQSPYIDVIGEQETGNLLKLMGRSADMAVDAVVAREVCIRGNRQVLLAGTIMPLGSTYVLTAEATDCHTGRRVVSATAHAGNKAEVAEALDSMAARLRFGLGESKASVEKYQVPIAEATTPSLDALMAYSEGVHLDGQRTHSTEVLPLYRKATELDPNFAMAYAALAEEYRRLGADETAAAYFKRAFELRDRVSTHEKLILEAQYYSAGVGDLPQALEAYRLWSATFPYDSMAVAEPVRVYLELGRYPEAIDAGERAIKLHPENLFLRQRLVLAYMRANRLAEAKELIAVSEALQKDSATMHRFGYEIAIAEHDASAAVREVLRPEPVGAATYGLKFVRGCTAMTGGQYREAREHFLGAEGDVQVAKLDEVLENYLVSQASEELQLGLSAEAIETLSRMAKPDENLPEYINVRLDLGQTADAERFLERNQASGSTLMLYSYLPRVRARLALHRGKPLEAIAALEPARLFELRDYTVPSLRGEAYLLAGQAEKAEAEYQKILANPGVDPVSPLYPLAHLGLARAYAAQKRRPESKAEYEKLFVLWAAADVDLPVLRRARAEYAALE